MQNNQGNWCLTVVRCNQLENQCRATDLILQLGGGWSCTAQNERALEAWPATRASVAAARQMQGLQGPLRRLSATRVTVGDMLK